MKNLLLLLFLLPCAAANLDAQQFPISAANMFTSPQNPSYVSMEMDSIPVHMQAGDFNWGIAIVGGLSTTGIENLLTDAGNAHINLILEGPFYNYGWAERLYFEAGESKIYFYNVHGALTSDGLSDQPPNDPYYDKQELQANVPNAWMVDSAKYDAVDPWVNGTLDTAYFRLKASSVGAPPTMVAKIEVYDETKDSVLNSQTLYTTSFTYANTWQTFKLGFMPPSHSSTSSPLLATSTSTTSINQPQFPLAQGRLAATEPSYPDLIDVRVWWYGLVGTWLDDIRVESTDGETGFAVDSLFSGCYNAGIKSEAGSFDTYSALSRYYLKDEPYTSQYLSYAYLNTVLDSVGTSHANGQGLGYTQKDEGLHLHPHDWTGDPWRRFMTESDPHELAAEVDKFLTGDQQPGTVGYTAMAQGELQNEMAKFDSAEADEFLSPSDSWRAHINSSQWTGTYREPHVSEISAQVYSALAHGAAGIDYFDFISAPYYSNVGLVDSTSLEPINGPPDAVYSNEQKWNGVAAINQNIATSLAPTLMNLTWQAAYSVDSVVAGPYGYISSVNTGDGDTTFVEIGEFKDGSGNNYFMLVNRRTAPWDSRSITTTLSPGSGSWVVTDVSSGNSWVVPDNGSFTDSFAAGAGKLYRLTPATFSASDTVASGKTMTIEPGATLEFGSGASLVVKGYLSASGLYNEPISFLPSSGSSPGSWGSIIFNSSSATTLEHCNVDYGTDIEVLNTNDVGIEYCNIMNSSSYGIYVYSSSYFLAEGDSIGNTNIYHGIIITGGTDNNCYENVVWKTNDNNSNGAGILYSGSGGTIGQNDVAWYDWGIGAIWGASPTSFWVTDTSRNNRVTNCYYGLMVYHNSYPDFGDAQYSPYSSNSIYGNTYNVSLDADGFNTDTLPAVWNYWNSSNPTSTFMVGSGSMVDWSPALSSDPWSGYPPSPKAGKASNNNVQIASAAYRANNPGFSNRESPSVAGTAQDSLLIGLHLRD